MTATPPAGRETVLVVDDDRDIRVGVRRFLQAKGYEVREAADCRSAEEAAALAPPRLVLLDQRLPDGSGIDLMRRLKDAHPETSVVVLTGHGSIDLAVRAIKEGASHFLTKPVDMEALLIVFTRLLDGQRGRHHLMAEQIREARQAANPFLGRSDAIRRLEEEVGLVLAVDRPVLIQGETGTGKGVLAKWLHEHGPRRFEAFVDLNCASLSRELLESELFGHEAGAFTGAVERKIGLLEVADRGTVFLDEIGDMDPAVQPKLLRAIEDRRIRRLGGVRDLRVESGLVAATHQDLPLLMAQKKFREDLYFRISAFPLTVPPLRQRVEDVEALAGYFLERFGDEMRRGPVRLSEPALEELRRYAWPGNVRELRNVVERAVIVCRESLISPEDLRLGRASAARPVAGGEWLTLAELERRHIAAVLEAEGGRVAPAARRLGISASSLYDRIKRHGLSSPNSGEPSRN